ncbi:MAG: hypothetical protein OXC62_05800, partial [Aestuariivita sp.]|nr:hypothetical protein [Aestuariivita sp.]
MPRIFLYKEIIAVLSENDNRWMTYAELADSVNKRGNYQRTSRAKTVDREPKHIRVRVRKHPYSRHFEIDGNKVRLSKYGIVTASNALAGDQYNMLKGSQSANVCIRENEAGILRLLEIMRRLRDPNTGCPWDIEQDFKSIAHHAIEEA